MSKVTIVNHNLHVEEKAGSSIPPGTYFTGRIGVYPCVLFLKFDDKIVALDTPSSHYWTGNPTVKNYQPVDVEIHVKEQK